MCGIAGFLSLDSNAIGKIQPIIGAASHRGPNGIYVYEDEKLALGHARLAIIDLSDAANQPMEAWDGKYVIVFNGEIYNYLELRRSLEDEGHRFKTASDTEVIIESYRRNGEECVKHFNGMWAFAIFDRIKNVLFCSRDRFGVKPFYYECSGREVRFASEIKQLTVGRSKIRGNADVLSCFIGTGLLGDGCKTCFDGIQQLQAGHNLFIDCATLACRVSRYYRIDSDQVFAGNAEEAKEELQRLLRDSVKLRLRSDVPVGTCLSGGLDSSGIACLAKGMYQNAQQRFTAITAGSVDTEIDESQFAARVCAHAKLNSISIRPTSDDVLEVIDRFSYHQDEPVASASPLMQYFVMRSAREGGIPVLLDGQGADEILLGYGRYLGYGMRHVVRSRSIIDAVGYLSRVTANNQRSGLFGIVKYAFGESHVAMWRALSRFRVPLRRTSSFGKILLDNHESATRNLQLYQRNEVEEFSLPLLLRYEDRNSMAFGIETRLPFLDYRVVELCVSLPWDYKVRDGWTKHVLRRAVSDVVPQEIAWRRDKIGFEAPSRDWFGKDNSALDQEIRSSGLVADLLNVGDIDRRLGRVNHNLRWRLYSVALWARMHGVSMLTQESV